MSANVSVRVLTWHFHRGCHLKTSPPAAPRVSALLPTTGLPKALLTMAEPEGDDEERYFSDPAVVRKIIPPFALLRLNSDVRGKLLGFLVCASQDRALRAINDERKAVYEDPLGKRSFYEKPRPPRAAPTERAPHA